MVLPSKMSQARGTVAPRTGSKVGAEKKHTAQNEV